MFVDKLPIPAHFDSQKVGELWRVPYQIRAQEAQNWSKQYNIQSSTTDECKICLLLIDVQNTFCLPDFELFVGGQSGRGAIDDNIRLCEFIYNNLGHITTIIPTMDTHTAMQIFHPIFWVNDSGENPQPLTVITLEDVQKGLWKVNPQMVFNHDKNHNDLQDHGLHYVQKLTENGKYPLIIWPYHSILGGVGHALVSAVEEAIFFHSISRHSPTQFELKGSNPLTENYSVFRPEVLSTVNDQLIASKNSSLIEKVLQFDKIIIAGQAKSHCVAWTIDDLLTEIQVRDANLARKVYLLEDCTSPVVVPGIVDFTAQSDLAFERFAQAGMHLVKSTTSLLEWE
jgi:nicotinamidase-related amidase